MAATIGVPLYACGGGTIPLLQQWLWDGMSVGSAAAFMLTGPSTKITNLGALKIVLGIKRFLLYLAYVMAFSFVTGGARKPHFITSIMPIPKGQRKPPLRPYEPASITGRKAGSPKARYAAYTVSVFSKEPELPYRVCHDAVKQAGAYSAVNCILGNRLFMVWSS